MVDVTIRGAGILGLSIAWECVQRGAKVRVIDPNGAGAGSSGGVVGALAPHVPENWNAKKAFQLDSLLRAEAFWKQVSETGGKSAGYARTGRLQPVETPAMHALALRRADSAEDLWQDQAFWRVETAPDNDWAPPSATGLVIHDNLAALLHPRQAIDALVAALAARDVLISPEGDDHGPVIWATGVAGLEALNAGHRRAVGSGVKGQAAVLDFNAAGQPQLFVDGLHIIPHLNGTVAIGSTSERDYETPGSTDHLLDTLIARARTLMPVLNSAPVLQRWAGVRPRARSRAPMLGRWPGRAGHFIANGGFKIGFGMAPKIAEMMAALVLEGRNTIPDGFEVEASF